MPQSLSQIVLHIIFSTKNRKPLIKTEIEKELFSYMASICNTHDCHAYKINGTETHIHIACNFSRTISVSKLVELVKKNSSKWIKTKGQYYKKFAWQNGYGVLSLAISQLPALQHYIEKQKTHHKTKTFQEEYCDFLKKYKIEYVEKYVWD